MIEELYGDKNRSVLINKMKKLHKAAWNYCSKSEILYNNLIVLRGMFFSVCIIPTHVLYWHLFIIESLETGIRFKTTLKIDNENFSSLFNSTENMDVMHDLALYTYNYYVHQSNEEYDVFLNNMKASISSYPANVKFCVEKMKDIVERISNATRHARHMKKKTTIAKKKKNAAPGAAAPRVITCSMNLLESMMGQCSVNSTVTATVTATAIITSPRVSTCDMNLLASMMGGTLTIF